MPRRNALVDFVTTLCISDVVLQPSPIVCFRSTPVTRLLEGLDEGFAGALTAGCGLPVLVADCFVKPALSKAGLTAGVEGVSAAVKARDVAGVKTGLVTVPGCSVFDSGLVTAPSTPAAFSRARMTEDGTLLVNTGTILSELVVTDVLL